MRRLLLPILAATLGSSVGLSQTFTSGVWSYTLNSSNEATITGYSELDGPVDIPLQIGGYPVTGIGQWAFALKGITSVSIPEGVKTIGAAAFLGCPYLPSVTIPASVTNVGSRAFYDCRGITNFTVLSGNTNYSSLGGVLFDASQETLVQFPIGRGGAYQVPNGVVRIGELAFAASLDPGLTFISLPDTVTHVDGGAFQNNTSLTNIEISKNLSVIGDGAFVNCGSLTNVILPNNLSVVGGDAFANCIALSNVFIPESVSAIGGGAFTRTAINNISIPESVTHIGVAAFQYCTSLMAINVEPANPTYTSIDGVLFDADERTLLQFACGRSGAYAIPSGTISLATGSFKGASNLTNVSIPNTVRSIEDEAFYDCSELTDIRIALGVTTIGLSCFSGCNALESIVFPHTLTRIGALTFDRCSSLHSILFLGNSPFIELHPFYPDLQSLGSPPNSLVNYLYGSVGWQALFGDLPTIMTRVFTEPQYAASRTQGQADVTTHPSTFNLYTQEQRASFGALQFSEGQNSVTIDPSAFGLFTQAQYDTNRTNGQRDVTTNPSAFGLFTQTEYDANRTNGIQSVATNLPSVNFSAVTSTAVRAGLGASAGLVVSEVQLPEGWFYDASTREIRGRLEGDNTVTAQFLGEFASNVVVPMTINFTPLPAPPINVVKLLPSARKVKTGRSAKLSVLVENNSTQPQTVTVAFTSSNEQVLAKPDDLTVTVRGKKAGSSRPSVLRVAVQLVGRAVGEADLTAVVGEVSSTPCIVTVR